MLKKTFFKLNYYTKGYNFSEHPTHPAWRPGAQPPHNISTDLAASAPYATTVRRVHFQTGGKTRALSVTSAILEPRSSVAWAVSARKLAGKWERVSIFVCIYICSCKLRVVVGCRISLSSFHCFGVLTVKGCILVTFYIKIKLVK